MSLADSRVIGCGRNFVEPGDAPAFPCHRGSSQVRGSQLDGGWLLRVLLVLRGGCWAPAAHNRHTCGRGCSLGHQGHGASDQARSWPVTESFDMKLVPPIVPYTRQRSELHVGQLDAEIDLALVAGWWMLREIEVSNARAHHILSQRGSAFPCSLPGSHPRRILKAN